MLPSLGSHSLLRWPGQLRLRRSMPTAVPQRALPAGLPSPPLCGPGAGPLNCALPLPSFLPSSDKLDKDQHPRWIVFIFEADYDVCLEVGAG